MLYKDGYYYLMIAEGKRQLERIIDDEALTGLVQEEPVSITRLILRVLVTSPDRTNPILPIQF